MDHSQNIVTVLTVRASMQGAAGWVMWFLVGLSVISITIIVERYIFLSWNRSQVSVIQSALNKLMASGQLAEARQLLKGARGLASRVVLEGLESLPRGRVATEEVMAGTTKAERVRYERGLSFLGTLGNNAPFVGLFGTVLEIIRSLHILSEKSGVGAGSVMSSLSEALAATAIGLLVALPAVATYNYFQRRIKIYATEADALGNVLLAYIAEQENKKRLPEDPSANPTMPPTPTNPTTPPASTPPTPVSTGG